MITEKYPYKELKKKNIDGSRKYLTPDGGKLPSVTTVLSATQSEEKKKGLQEWRKRVGYAKAQEITTEAAGRGTRMHKWLENYVISEDGDMGQYGSNPYSKQSHIMASVIIDKGLVNCDEYWGTEVTLYFPEIYAGTTDLVGVHSGDEAIMDHKQTNRPKKREWIDDYFIQMTAYADAHNELYGTSIKKGVIFMCSKDYEYQEFIVEGKEFDKYHQLWLKKLEEYYTKYI